MKRILSILSIAALCITGYSKDYYVDMVGGNDANDGSQLSPYRHCPGDVNATGNAAATVLAGGDAVLFKGGVQYTDTVLLNWSGSAGNPITYDGGGWGTGRALIDGQNDTNKLYGFYGSGNSNLVFKSFEMKRWGGHGTEAWDCSSTRDYNGWGIALYGSKNITVRDSLFRDIGDWTNSVDMSEAHMNGIGVLFDYNSSGNVVTNCEFTKIGMAGIRIQAYNTGLYATNNRVIDCRFHDYIRWGVDIASASANAQISDIIIDRCTFYNYYQYDATTWIGCPNSWPHTDPIIMRLGNVPPVGGQTLGTVTQPNIVRNCYWYNDTPVQYGAGTAGIFLTTWGGRLLIYNNVFNNVLMHGEGAIYCQDGTDPVTNPSALPDFHFYNNTFFGDTYAIALRTITSPLASYALTNGTVRIANNAIYKTDSGAAMGLLWGLDGYSIPTQCDYNRHYAPQRSPWGSEVGYIWYGGAGHYVTFTQFQAQGFDAHGSYGNPAFENVTYGLGTLSSLNDFHLQSGSPCIGVATNLSAYFTTDYSGITRTNWDVGSYAFTGTSPSPPPPVKGLKITGGIHGAGGLLFH